MLTPDGVSHCSWILSVPPGCWLDFLFAVVGLISYLFSSVTVLLCSPGLPYICDTPSTSVSLWLGLEYGTHLVAGLTLDSFFLGL